MERPIFVVGTQRSGTTLLRLILDSHERIAIGHESGFMRAVATTKHLPDYIYGDGWYRRFGVDDAGMNQRIREFYASIFAHYARLQGKPRWGEKTPDNIFEVDEIARIFWDAQFVCTVRHAGGVIASLERWNWTFERALDYWMRAAEAALEAAERLGADRWHLVRYEDLVSRPENVLRGVVAYLGEPWSDNLMRHHEVQKGRSGGVEVEGDNRDDRPIDPSRLADWRLRLPPELIESIEARAGGLLSRLDYRVPVSDGR
jgi:hypothetical protein